MRKIDSRLVIPTANGSVSAYCHHTLNTNTGGWEYEVEKHEHDKKEKSERENLITNRLPQPLSYSAKQPIGKKQSSRAGLEPPTSDEEVFRSS